MAKVGRESDKWEHASSDVFQSVLSNLVTARVTSESDSPDIFLYAKGSDSTIVGVAEVKAPRDEKLMGLNKALFSSGGQCGDLPEGFGTWNIQITSSFRGKKTAEVITKLVGDCISLGVSTSNMEHETTGHVSLVRTLKQLGIQHITKFGNITGDRFYISSSRGGFIGSGLIGLREWMLALGEKQSFQNSLANLVGAGGVETHLFIWLLDGAPESLFFGAKFFPEATPVEIPIAFDGVQNYWFGMPPSDSSNYVVWQYRFESGWVMHTVPRSMGE